MLRLWKSKTGDLPEPISTPVRDRTTEAWGEEAAAPATVQAPVSPPVAPMRFQPAPQRQTPWHLRIGHAPASRRAGGPGPVLAIAALVAVLALGAGLRKSLVSAVPETAGLFAALGMPVNLRGLELREVKSGIFTESSVELLVVQGEIANVTSKPKEIPPLLFTVRDAKGVTVYSWSASADVRTLEPGAKASFRRRLASPPQEGMEVLVRFAGKPEQVAFAH